MRLRDFAPRSLYVRFLLIIIVPTVIVQLVAVYMFYQRHWTSMTRNLSTSLSGEIALAVDTFAKTPPDKHEELFLKHRDFMNLRMSFQKNATLPGFASQDSLAVHAPMKYKRFASGLRKFLEVPFTITNSSDGSDIVISTQLADGILTLTTSDKRLANPTTYIFVMWMTGTAAILLLVSIMFLRNQVRSIVRLTQAAERFGKGQDMPHFKPSGAKEVRRAAIAFIEMRERIKRLITRRTQMLAGVSHDLRTPLTRMKLQLAMMRRSKKVEALRSDVEEMENMLEGYLDFARGESNEPTDDIELIHFIEDILITYPNYQGTLECTIPEDIIIHGKPNALRRCFINLIENAMRYANVITLSSSSINEERLELYVDDNGPGIPENERNEVFQPFYRLDPSRNSETGGVGLGLSIARDIIHSHGGEISLQDSPLGGLRVQISLPL